MQDETLTDRQAEYRAYLRTPAWSERRTVALERAGHRCQVCNRDKQLDVHHRTYERIFNEDPADLTVLCRKCHDLHHGSGRGQVKARKPRKPKQPRTRPEREAVWRRQIPEFLKAQPGARPAEVAMRFGISRAKANGRLGCLNNDRVVKVDGLWYALSDDRKPMGYVAPIMRKAA